MNNFFFFSMFLLWLFILHDGFLASASLILKVKLKNSCEYISSIPTNAIILKRLIALNTTP